MKKLNCFSQMDLRRHHQKNVFIKKLIMFLSTFKIYLLKIVFLIVKRNKKFSMSDIKFGSVKTKVQFVFSP